MQAATSGGRSHCGEKSWRIVGSGGLGFYVSLGGWCLWKSWVRTARLESKCRV